MLNLACDGQCRGFTLIEFTTALAVAAILFTLAAPSFSWLIQSSAMSSTVNTFLADIRYARSESIRRGGGVVMCRSDAPEAASPVCGTGTGSGGAGWASGWIIFHNLDPAANGGVRVESDRVLRVQAPIHALNSMLEAGSTESTQFRFTGTGRLLGLGAPVTLEFGSSPTWTSTTQRRVCVGSGGYARMAGNGTAAC